MLVTSLKPADSLVEIQRSLNISEQCLRRLFDDLGGLPSLSEKLRNRMEEYPSLIACHNARSEGLEREIHRGRKISAEELAGYR